MDDSSRQVLRYAKTVCSNVMEHGTGVQVGLVQDYDPESEALFHSS